MVVVMVVVVVVVVVVMRDYILSLWGTAPLPILISCNSCQVMVLTVKMR